MKNKALFLDRDGVINEAVPEGEYVVLRVGFHLRPVIIPLIRFARAAGYLVVVVTNQRGVALGKMSQVDLDDVHAYMRELLMAQDAAVDAIYSCTHGLTDNCDCRKPKPGMFFAAARDLDIDLGESIMIGDRPTDIEAGKAAGCKAMLLIA